MKPKTILIPHEIKCEKDLPKEAKLYFVLAEFDAYMIEYDPLDEYEKDQWLKHYKFWLEKKEVPTDKETHKEADNMFAGPLVDKFGDKAEGFYLGISWFKSKLGI